MKNESSRMKSFQVKGLDSQEEPPFCDDGCKKEDVGAEWGNLVILEETVDSQWW